MPTIIREADLIESVADALQYISYYHPMDYIRALGDAYRAEQGPAAKDAIAQMMGYLPHPNIIIPHEAVSYTHLTLPTSDLV